VRECRRSRRSWQVTCSAACAQFAGFTGTKEQILTQLPQEIEEELAGHMLFCFSRMCTQFTCFTGTKALMHEAFDFYY
jgi:hypothetical protein